MNLSTLLMVRESGKTGNQSYPMRRDPRFRKHHVSGWADFVPQCLFEQIQAMLEAYSDMASLFDREPMAQGSQEKFWLLWSYVCEE